MKRFIPYLSLGVSVLFLYGGIRALLEVRSLQVGDFVLAVLFLVVFFVVKRK